MKKPLLLLFCFIVLGVSVFAQRTSNFPIGTQTTTNTFCQIEYGGPLNWKYGENREVHFHVVNGSGFPLTQDNITCSVHLYGDEGEQYFANNTISSSNLDFETIINASNISEFHNSIIFQCKTNNDGCFTTYEILATTSGRQNVETEYAILLFMIIVSLIPLLFAIYRHSKTNKLDDDLKDMVTSQYCQKKKKYTLYILWTRALIIASILSFMFTASVVDSMASHTNNVIYTSIDMFFYIIIFLGCFGFVWIAIKMILDLIVYAKVSTEEREAQRRGL